MKMFLALILGTGLISAVVDTPDAKLASYTQNRMQMVKVTDKPQHMQLQVAMACAPAMMGSPHDNKYFDVYISKGGYSTLLEGKGIYPLGTVLLKQKYSDKSAAATELYTGMLKREKGYNPSGGDWEYFVVSGDGQKVSERGALQSCMGCHEMYSATDYVTRQYPLKKLQAELPLDQKAR